MLIYPTHESVLKILVVLPNYVIWPKRKLKIEKAKHERKEDNTRRQLYITALGMHVPVFPVVEALRRFLGGTFVPSAIAISRRQ